MSDIMDDIANLASQEGTTTTKASSGAVEIQLTGSDADALRSFRKGKPMEKGGKALVEGNGPRLKKLCALHRNSEYAGIADAPSKFVLKCSNEVAKDGDGEVIKDKDGNPVVKPAAEAKVSIRTGSYTRYGFSKEKYESMLAITQKQILQASANHDAKMIDGTDEEVAKAKQLLESREGEHEVWTNHFTKKVNIVINANAIPRELLPDVLQLLSKMKALQVELDERTIAMPAEAIDTTPVYMPKSTFDDARRTELAQDTNSLFEETVVNTPAMIT